MQNNYICIVFHNVMSLNEVLISGLKLNRGTSSEIAKDESNTMLAWIIISVMILLESIMAFFSGNPGNSGYAGLAQTGVIAVFLQILSGLVGYIFQTYMLYIVVNKLFRGEGTFNGILILFASAMIWNYIGFIIGLVFDNMFIGILIWLIFNFALLFGLIGYTKLVAWKSFLSIVIAFAVSFIGLVVTGIIIKMILGI